MNNIKISSARDEEDTAFMKILNLIKSTNGIMNSITKNHL